MESRIELGGSRTFSIENVLVPPTTILLNIMHAAEKSKWLKRGQLHVIF